MRNLPAYTVEVAPAPGGFMASIFRIEVENERITSREFWRTLDLPRPTRNLARKDAEDLATTELYREASGNDRSSTGETSPPNVTAEQIMERAHADGFTGIGDGLRTYLGDVPRPYALGFERAIHGLLPPKEIALRLYLKGYEDGQTAYPILLEAGAMGTGAVAASYRDPRHWRDQPNFPRNEGVILNDSDQFADYTIERMALDIQPVFEPGYPPVEGEIRELRVKHYLQAIATLHERPLPKDWFYAFRPFTGAHPEYEIDLRSVVTPGQIAHLGYSDGRVSLTRDYNHSGDEDRPESSDPQWALDEAKRLARQIDVYLQRRRNEGPDVWVQDPAITDLQRSATLLRRSKESGPLQIAELSDEEAAERGEEGWSTQQTERRWNEQSRNGFAKRMAELEEVEHELRERGADPNGRGDLDELEKASQENRSWYLPRGPRPAAGWELYSAPGITDEQLLREVAVVIEAVSPGEFVAEIAGPRLIEITFRNPPLLPMPAPPRNRLRIPGYEPDNPLYRILWHLQRPLVMAARRWWVKPWAMPPPRGLDESDRWEYPQPVRWHSRIKRGPRLGASQPDNYNDPRLTHMEVQLAPPGSRAPVEWEC